MRRFLLFLGLLGIANAQYTNYDYDKLFSTTRTASLSGAAEVFTVQHNLTSSETDRFVSIYMYCSVACTVTLERNGINTAGTSNTIVNLNPANPLVATTTVTATYTTTVTAVTVINVYQLAAGTSFTLDGSVFQLPANSSDNLTLRTSSITGTAQLQITWRKM
jgi:hypothetical protein